MSLRVPAAGFTATFLKQSAQTAYMLFSILRRVRIYGNRRFDADDVVDGPALGFEHSDQGVEDGLSLCYGIAGVSDVAVSVGVDLAG